MVAKGRIAPALSPWELGWGGVRVGRKRHMTVSVAQLGLPKDRVYVARTSGTLYSICLKNKAAH